VPDLAVPDARRLVEAAARFHHHLADAFVFEQHSAFQHINELDLAIVHVPFAVRCLAGPGADHVRDDLAARGAPDAEVAVLEVAAQAAPQKSAAFKVRNAQAGAVHAAEILR
jgi:hypothetical protein